MRKLARQLLCVQKQLAGAAEARTGWSSMLWYMILLLR